MAIGIADRGLEVDGVSFLVRAQKFRVAAMIMKRTPLALATEYATRLVHLVHGTRLEDMAGFFNLDAANQKFCLRTFSAQDLLLSEMGSWYYRKGGAKRCRP